MKHRIYKYHLPLQRKITLKVPVTSYEKKVAIVNDELWIWMQVDPESPLIDKHFQIIATGQEVPGPKSLYIDTVFQREFVWHVFVDI